jgi:hypothetical protein
MSRFSVDFWAGWAAAAESRHPAATALPQIRAGGSMRVMKRLPESS